MPEKSRCGWSASSLSGAQSASWASSAIFAPLRSIGEPDLEGEAGIGVHQLLGDHREIHRHAVAQPLVAGTLAPQPLDLLARIGPLERLPDRVQRVAAAAGPAVGLARPGAARDHLLVLAGRRPPGGPLRLGDDAGEDVADLAGGQRPVVALERGAQQLGRAHRLEHGRVLQLAPQHVLGRQRPQQLRRRLEADRQAADPLEVDLEALQPEVRLHHPADPLALHRHHRADVEGEQALQAVDLLPDLGDVARRPVEPHGLVQRLVGRAVAVELAEAGGDGGVELVGGEEQRAGAFEELQAKGPQAALAQMVVQQLEERAGPRLLAGADQGTRHADEVLEIRRVFLDPGQPVALDRVVIAFGQLGLCGSGNRHRRVGRYQILLGGCPETAGNRRIEWTGPDSCWRDGDERAPMNDGRPKGIERSRAGRRFDPGTERRVKL